MASNKLNLAKDKAMLEAKEIAPVVVFGGFYYNGEHWDGILSSLPRRRIKLEGHWIGARDQRDINAGRGTRMPAFVVEIDNR